MKKEHIKRVMVIILIATLFTIAITENRKTVQQREQQVVEKYVECLKENFTQRDYCGRKVGESYQWLDRKLSDYGYCYETDGINLYIRSIKK